MTDTLVQSVPEPVGVLKYINDDAIVVMRFPLNHSHVPHMGHLIHIQEKYPSGHLGYVKIRLSLTQDWEQNKRVYESGQEK